jgi:ribose/xylose/arabinose/galactoside ABC-type transport system permease subunit
MGVIIYPMVGLVSGWSEFFSFLLVLVLFNLTSAALCLFIGIVFQESGVANLIGSLVMLFSLLFAGLLLNHGKTQYDMKLIYRFYSSRIWMGSKPVNIPLCL